MPFMLWALISYMTGEAFHGYFIFLLKFLPEVYYFAWHRPVTVPNGIRTYVIGHYNPSVKIIELVSHITYVVCVNF